MIRTTIQFYTPRLTLSLADVSMLALYCRARRKNVVLIKIKMKRCNKSVLTLSTFAQFLKVQFCLSYSLFVCLTMNCTFPFCSRYGFHHLYMLCRILPTLHFLCLSFALTPEHETQPLSGMENRISTVRP